VRRTILAHAARLAAQRAAAGGTLKTRPTAQERWWRPAMLGTLAAAGLAALMIAPRFLSPTASPTEASPTETSPTAGAVVTQALEPAAPARPPVPAQSAGLPSRVARARPKVNEAVAPLAAQSGPPAPTRAWETAGTDAAVAGGAPAREAQLPGSPSASTSIAAAARIGTNPAAALRRAAEVGDLAALKTLAEKQTDVDSRDTAGRTALMLATLHGQADAVITLLDHGADPNAADANGTTPLQAATAGDDPTIVAVLRRYGAR
jgi:hypothetical protein